VIVPKPFNPLVITLENVPPEWDDIDLELWERIRPDENGLITHAQFKQIREIRAARWVLVTNDRRARCNRCNRIHEYLTLGCIERPFNTFDEVLIYEKQVAREQGAIRGENLIITTQTVYETRLGRPVPITRKKAKELKLRIRSKLGRKAL
jgi:hypothetical protein